MVLASVLILVCVGVCFVWLACATRCPMHLAAASGRLLAVSYLLGVSANPNTRDRWGGTPMDDCVRGRYEL